MVVTSAVFVDDLTTAVDGILLCNAKWAELGTIIGVDIVDRDGYGTFTGYVGVE